MNQAELLELQKTVSYAHTDITELIRVTEIYLNNPTNLNRQALEVWISSGRKSLPRLEDAFRTIFDEVHMPKPTRRWYQFWK